MQRDVWSVFRARLATGDPRAMRVPHWLAIRALAGQSDLDAARVTFAAHIASLDDAAYALFRDTFNLVYVARVQAAELQPITDPAEWLRLAEIYVATGTPEAQRFRNLAWFHMDIDTLRALPPTGDVYTPAEVELGADVTTLFDRAAPFISRTAGGAPAREAAEGLIAVVADYRQLIARSDSGNRSLPHARDMCAQTMEWVARTFEALHDGEAARPWYLETARAYAEANLDDYARAAVKRLEAMIIAQTGNVDAAVIASVTALIDDPQGLERVDALVALLQRRLDGGDLFGANEVAVEAAQALAGAGYVDPADGQIDDAFAAWITTVPPELARNDFIRRLSAIVQAYAVILRARSAVATLRSEPDVAFMQVTALGALVTNMAVESAAQLRELDELWAEMTVVPAAVRTSTGDTGVFTDGNALAVELAAISEQRTAASSAGAPLDDLLARAEQAQARTRALGIRRLIAAFANLRSDMLIERKEAAAAASLLDETRLELFPETAANQPCTRDAHERAIFVDVLTHLAVAQSVLGNVTQVFDTAGAAIAEVERDRYSISSPYLESSFFATRAKLYAIGVWAAWITGAYEAMLERMDLSKARSLALTRAGTTVPFLDRTDLEQRFRAITQKLDVTPGNEESAAKRRRIWELLTIERTSGQRAGANFSLIKLQAALRGDEALITYYWLSAATLLVCAVDTAGIVVESSAFTDEERADLDRLAAATAALRTLNKALDRKLATLSVKLIPESIRAFAAKKSRLVVSQHRVLHQIPFHALAWDGDVVIERFAVSYAPNLSALLVGPESEPCPGVLVAGTNEYDYTYEGQAIDTLAGPQNELAAITRTYEGAGTAVTALLDRNDTKAALLALDASGELTSFGTLHFASHGLNAASEQPMEAKLFFRDAVMDGLEISGLHLNARLVVLSACFSGQRPIAGRWMSELGGDDLFGLQAAFASAGARAVLGSLWVANDTAATWLMTAVHTELARGNDPDIALQTAILAYRANFPDRRQAYYWAPFFLSVLGRRTR